MRRALAALLLFLLAGCPAPLAPDEGGRILIRVANASDVAFERVVVIFADGQKEDYGAIAAGFASDYRDVREAYRYAYISVHFETDSLVLQPIDYVGESLLGAGRYTYALAVDTTRRSMSLTFLSE